MDDILERLRNVESGVSELKAQVSAILAIIPHLATKADVESVRVDVAGVKAELKAEIASMETAIIKWIVATVLTSAGLAFTIAKFVH